MSILANELNKVLDTLDVEELTDEEKEIIRQEAIDKFNEIPVTEFKQISEDDSEEDKLNNDFISTRNILIGNIHKLEKLTEIVFQNLAESPTNYNLTQTAISVISEQSKNIKLMLELKSKHLLNHKTTVQIDKEKNGKKKNNSLPPGLSLK